jgi:FliI/YscN family ATPase
MRERRTITAPPPSAMDRPPIDRPLATGVRAIDGLLTLGVGQRVGIFSGSGVGKSTLLGQIAKFSQADLNVIALVGERGREVREFLERDLGTEGLAKSVVVVATGDEPALHRSRAAFVATTIAEYFRDLGKNVLLMMDSVTRFALAQREIGFARGEAPVTRGYPPSVFSTLPKLLERSGRSETGSITGIYSVLVEGDDMNEPISDTVRGILDGHIVLSRKLADKAHWPAIDVLGSISRLMNHLADASHRQAADQVRELLAAYRESEDFILLGAYQKGTSALIDRAIQLRDGIHRLVRQRPEEHQAFADTIKQLVQLVKPAP